MKGTVLLAACLMLVGVGGIAAAGWPIRFPEEAPTTNGALPEDTRILDAHLFDVAVDYGQVSEDLDTPAVASRCGDLDGCTVLMVLDVFQDGQPDRADQRLLKTSADGRSWTILEFGDSSAPPYGDLDSAPDEVLFKLSVAGLGECRLEEERDLFLGVGSYSLAVTDYGLNGITARCTLKIED